jgi:hypothetical protein
MWYELWDGETGNRVGTYASEGDALRAVLADVHRYGRGSKALTSLGLLRSDPENKQGCLIAKGPELVERSLALEPKTEQPSDLTR